MLSGRKDFLPVEPQSGSLLPLSPRRTQGSPKTTPVPSVWPSPDMLPPPRRPLQAQEYRLRLKQLLPRLINSRGTCHFNPLPVSFLAALALPDLLPRVALLTLRFRVEKYAQHTFSTETERRKNSGSSQSLASLLRLTTTN
jgi:hypothetical protein